MQFISRSHWNGRTSVIFTTMLATLVCLLTANASAATRATQESAPPQKNEQAKQGPAPISEAEQQALKKINAAGDAKAKLDEAAAFIKKFPKSTMTNRLARYMIGAIGSEADNSKKIELCESFIKVFKGSGYDDLITPVYIAALVNEKKEGEAFKLAPGWLQKHPDDVVVLTRMALVGADEARKENNAHLAESKKWGDAAIAIIEAGNKPESFDDAQWHEYQTRWLANLYQSMGLVAMISNDKAAARAKLDRSAQIDPTNPFTFAFLGGLLNEDYQETAQRYLAASAGTEKDNLRKKSVTLMEQVVEAYARSVALSEDKPEYKQLHDQILEDMTVYYKFLHDNSTDGMQDYINKFKKT